ncbi:MAG TPA: hypothetical protein VF423_03415 [Actinomycetes bacterium]|jgi:hypothetical protein
MSAPSHFTMICPACQAEVTMTARRLLVRVDADRSTSGEALFTCLFCHATVAVPVGATGVAALVSGGVTFLSLSAPVVEHPEARPAGPAFTPDDLIDLHADLEDDECWLTGLVGQDG